MTEHRDAWPTDQPPRERGLFQLYEKFSTLEAVLAAFAVKYGHVPKYAKLDGGGWLVGPIREGDAS